MTEKIRLPRRTFLRQAATAAVGTILTSGLAIPLSAKTQHSYLLGTGTTGGTYYPVGVAIATLVKV